MCPTANKCKTFKYDKVNVECDTVGPVDILKFIDRFILVLLYKSYKVPGEIITKLLYNQTISNIIVTVVLHNCFVRYVTGRLAILVTSPILIYNWLYG